MSDDSIRYLERREIDDQRWNACIHRSENGLVYSDIEYLDAMAPHWSALVLNNYEAVMPLPWNRKFGIGYVYPPTFCQQCGITTQLTDDRLTDRFLSAIPSQFRFGELQLNAANRSNTHQAVLRTNYLLDLARDADTLRKGYSRNASRNIRHAASLSLRLDQEIAPEVIARLHRQRFGRQAPVQDLARLVPLLNRWIGDGRAVTFAARDHDNHVLASSAYLIYKQRITFILNGNPARYLDTGATHWLKDQVIGKYAGRGYVMDFEGSDNADFARFYTQFGATAAERYPRLTINRLPWLLRWWKR